jgi:diguanylate cyclase (GGDEF)-like protein
LPAESQANRYPPPAGDPVEDIQAPATTAVSILAKPTPARALLPEEPRQALRVQRAIISAIGSVILSATMVALHEVHLLRLSSGGLVAAIALLWAGNALFLIAVRTGWNERFADPSMTLAQVSWATSYLMVLSYFADDIRTLVLFMTVASLALGMLQLKFREFLILSLTASAGYAVVLTFIALDPARDFNPVQDIIVWMVYTIIAIGFAWLGGRAAQLRSILRERNSRLRALVQTLQAQSTTDELTGIHNRRFMLSQLARHKDHADRGGANFYVGFADLDRFKSINDQFGHGIGDEVLKAFADIASNKLRTFDSFARYGGEEFVFLVSDTTNEGALAAAERLRAGCMAHDFTRFAKDLNVTVSIGLTQYACGESVDDTLSRADQGLYAAKAGGRDRVEFQQLPNAEDDPNAQEAGQTA